MKLGFYTAVLSDISIDDVAEFAAGAGFESLEIDAGAHIPDLAAGERAVRAVTERGLQACALTSGGGLVGDDRADAQRTQERLSAAVDLAASVGVPAVAGFCGRDHSLSEEDNYRELGSVLGPIVERAEAAGIKVVIENWPGPGVDWCATTPAGWELLFAQVPSPALGLNLDPSHLVWQGIDHDVALDRFADRVFLSHAKDTEIFSDKVQQRGYFSEGWWTYRLPGHGQIDWRTWLEHLQGTGFEGSVTIEHEDGEWGAWGGSVEERQRGLAEGLRVLREALGRG